MPKDSIRSLVMSAEKEAVKRFISHMHQSWDQLQVETSQVNSTSLFIVLTVNFHHACLVHVHQTTVCLPRMSGSVGEV